MKHLILLLLLSGCADEYSLAIEKEFSNEEIQMIESAVDEWMEACDCYDASVFFRYDLPTTTTLQYSNFLTTRSYGRIWKVHTNEPAYIDGEKEKDGVSFRGMHFDGNIMLVDGKLDKMFYPVILHELGHMYGIKHQVSGVMLGDGDIPGCIDWLALSEFCDEHACGPKAEPTCVPTK